MTTAAKIEAAEGREPIKLVRYNSLEEARKDPHFPDAPYESGWEVLTDPGGHPFGISNSGPNSKVARFINAGYALVLAGKSKASGNEISLMVNLPANVYGKSREEFYKMMRGAIAGFRNSTVEETRDAVAIGGYVGRPLRDHLFTIGYNLYRYYQLRKVLSWVQNEAGLSIPTKVGPKLEAQHTHVYYHTPDKILMVIQEGR